MKINKAVTKTQDAIGKRMDLYERLLSDAQMKLLRSLAERSRKIDRHAIEVERLSLRLQGHQRDLAVSICGVEAYA